MLRRSLKLYSCLFVFVLGIAGSLVAAVETISIDSQVDKSKITIGDLVTYSIVVKFSNDIQVTMPELAENLGMFEIRDYKVHDPVVQNNLTTQEIDYIISTFDIGEFEIPPLTFYYSVPEDTLAHELKTKKLKIVVESMKPSEAGDIRDVKTPLELPRNFTKIILWGSGILAVLLLAAGLFIWYRKRSGKDLLPQKTEPPGPAHEVALEALRKLKASDLLAEGKIKEYYVEISEIIRHYIEGRYFITALELTTYELMLNLKTAQSDEQEMALMQDFLNRCDLVKFARYIPTNDENAAILDRAFEIVEHTKLVYDQVNPDEPEDGEGTVVETKMATQIEDQEVKAS